MNTADCINRLITVCDKALTRIEKLEETVKYLESRVDQLENPDDTKYTG